MSAFEGNILQDFFTSAGSGKCDIFRIQSDLTSIRPGKTVATLSTGLATEEGCGWIDSLNTPILLFFALNNRLRHK